MVDIKASEPINDICTISVRVVFVETEVQTSQLNIDEILAEFTKKIMIEIISQAKLDVSSMIPTFNYNIISNLIFIII